MRGAADFVWVGGVLIVYGCWEPQLLGEHLGFRVYVAPSVKVYDTGYYLSAHVLALRDLLAVSDSYSRRVPTISTYDSPGSAEWAVYMLLPRPAQDALDRGLTPLRQGEILLFPVSGPPGRGRRLRVSRVSFPESRIKSSTGGWRSSSPAPGGGPAHCTPTFPTGARRCTATEAIGTWCWGRAGTWPLV